MTTNSLTHLNINFNGASFLLDVAEGKLMSLNTIYAAAGSPAGKEPWRWLDTEGSKQFIDSVCEILNLAKTVVLKVKRGRRGGGTWAHWKIAVRYAAYLAPALDSAILDVFQERVQEEIDPGKAIDRGIAGYKKQGKSDEWINRRLIAKSGWIALTDTLKEHDVHGSGYSQAADSINVPIIGKTAKEFKAENGLKKHHSTRNELDDIELNMISLSQALSKRKIVDNDIRGNFRCAKVCFDVSTKVAALKDMV